MAMQDVDVWTAPGVVVRCLTLWASVLVLNARSGRESLIVLFWWLFEGLWRPVRGRIRDFAVLAGIGLAGVLTLLPQILTVSAEADDISAFELQINADRAATWGKALYR